MHFILGQNLVLDINLFSLILINKHKILKKNELTKHKYQLF